MDKNQVYEYAKAMSVRLSINTYVWESDFGDWKYGTDFPDQYAEIIAEFKNGVNIWKEN